MKGEVIGYGRGAWINWVVKDAVGRERKGVDKMGSGKRNRERDRGRDREG